MADFSHEGKFNKNRNFNKVKFGSGAKLLEVELLEMQDIQNYRRDFAIANVLGNGFINKPTMSLSSGTLIMPADTVVCNGEIFAYSESMTLSVTSGQTVYLACSLNEMNYSMTLYSDGNQSGGSTIPNDMIDSRQGVETTRRIQRIIRLVTDNSDNTKTYITVATITDANTFTDVRPYAEYVIGNLGRSDVIYDIFKKIGFGTVENISVSKTAGVPMGITIAATKAYFANGVKKSFNAIAKTFDIPVIETNTNEDHTTTINLVNTTKCPIVNDSGVIDGSGVTVTKVSDGSSVTINSVDAVTGALNLALTENTAVNINYKSGKSRYDVVYISPDGTNTLVKGTSSYSSPVKPSIPSGALELVTVLIEPKETTMEIATGDIAAKRYDVGSGNGIEVSATEPASKYENMFWLNPTNNVLKRWDGEAWHIISGGITVPYYHNVTLESAVNEVSIGISTFDYTKDTLLVFQNSTYISKPDDYTLSADGDSIVKTSGTWNIGTEFNFVVLASVSEDADILNISRLTSAYTATADGETVLPINNSAYNSTTDVLEVYFSNMLLFESADYTINNDAAHITLINGNVLNTGEIVRYCVWKRVRTAAGTFDGALVEDGSITEIKLNAALDDKINTQYITDGVTGTKYKLIVENGVLGIQEV